ncbi:MAG: ATP-binding cassette domain-containing protein, partial [Okeania sp. SIO2H7]|nr:ATP-binding cassette domain-containing protein [Okeania sp. SIO2H7]
MAFQSGKQHFHVLRDINLAVEKGDVQLLMGPSGSGKTTLLSILAGLLTPTAGKVFLQGQEITKMSRTKLAKFRLHNIGFIFQGFNLFPALTAIENIEVALNIKGIKGKTAKKEAIALLQEVGLGDKINSHPRDL